MYWQAILLVLAAVAVGAWYLAYSSSREERLLRHAYEYAGYDMASLSARQHQPPAILLVDGLRSHQSLLSRRARLLAERVREHTKEDDVFLVESEGLFERMLSAHLKYCPVKEDNERALEIIDIGLSFGFRLERGAKNEKLAEQVRSWAIDSQTWCEVVLAHAQRLHDQARYEAYSELDLLE